jgi:hypothetical protein
MKKVLFTILILAGSLWGCEKENQRDVSPLEQQKSLNVGRNGFLTSDELAVANSMGKIIPVSTFKSMTDAYQKTASSKDTRAVAYGATVIDEILNQKGCVGLRFYLAKDSDGRTTILFVGIDKNGNDITSSSGGRTTADNFTAGDGPLCPRECSN